MIRLSPLAGISPQTTTVKIEASGPPSGGIRRSPLSGLPAPPVQTASAVSGGVRRSPLYVDPATEKPAPVKVSVKMSMIPAGEPSRRGKRGAVRAQPVSGHVIRAPQKNAPAPTPQVTGFRTMDQLRSIKL